MSDTRDTFLPGSLNVNGQVLVARDPQASLEVATKQYVDFVAAFGSGGGGGGGNTSKDVKFLDTFQGNGLLTAHTPDTGSVWQAFQMQAFPGTGSIQGYTVNNGLYGSGVCPLIAPYLSISDHHVIEVQIERKTNGNMNARVGFGRVLEDTWFADFVDYGDGFINIEFKFINADGIKQSVGTRSHYVDFIKNNVFTLKIEMQYGSWVAYFDGTQVASYDLDPEHITTQSGTPWLQLNNADAMTFRSFEVYEPGTGGGGGGGTSTLSDFIKKDGSIAMAAALQVSNDGIQFPNGNALLNDNFLSLKTNGSSRLQINAQGNVGIGTAPTEHKLDVQGSIKSQTGFVFPDGTTQTTSATDLKIKASSGPLTPALAFFQDSDTGFYSPGANQLSLATGGVEGLRVDANQNVHIGSVGTQKLNVQGFVWTHGIQFQDGTTQTTAGAGGDASNRVLKTGDTMTGALVLPNTSVAVGPALKLGGTRSGLNASDASTVEVLVNGTENLRMTPTTTNVRTTLVLQSGTAAAPTLHFGVTNSGLYRNASQETSFSHLGQDIMAVQSDGVSGTAFYGDTLGFKSQKTTNLQISGSQVQLKVQGTNVVALGAVSTFQDVNVQKSGTTTLTLQPLTTGNGVMVLKGTNGGYGELQGDILRVRAQSLDLMATNTEMEVRPGFVKVLNSLVFPDGTSQTSGGASKVYVDTQDASLTADINTRALANNGTLSGTLTLANNTVLTGDFGTTANTPVFRSNTGTTSQVRVSAPSSGDRASFGAYGSMDLSNSNVVLVQSRSTDEHARFMVGKNVGGSSQNPNANTRIKFLGLGGTEYANILLGSGVQNFQDSADAVTLTTKEYVDSRSGQNAHDPSFSGTMTLGTNFLIKGDFGNSSAATIIQGHDTASATFLRLRGPVNQNSSSAGVIFYGHSDPQNTSTMRLTQSSLSTDVTMAVGSLVSGANTDPANTTAFIIKGFGTNEVYGHVPFTASLADWKTKSQPRSLTTKEYVDDRSEFKYESATALGTFADQSAAPLVTAHVVEAVSSDATGERGVRLSTSNPPNRNVRIMNVGSNPLSVYANMINNADDSTAISISGNSMISLVWSPAKSKWFVQSIS